MDADESSLIMSAKHAENPHTFQSLQLNLRGEGNAEREKMKGDVTAGKHTKEPPQSSFSSTASALRILALTNRRYHLPPSLAQHRHCSLRSKETLNEADVSMYVCVYLQK